MANWQEYHRQFAGALKGAIHSATSTTDSDLKDKLATLIDNWPYYGNPDWTSCHRDTLSNLLQTHLPNEAITEPPGYSNMAGSQINSYAGPFSGYRDAFFHGVQASPAAERLQSMTGAEEPQIGSQTHSGSRAEWDSLWNSYSVAVLTDAVHKTISISIDTSKLNAALANYQKTFEPFLAASCLAVFETGFTPTVTPLNVILTAGKGQAAATLLSSEIQAGQFTANINQAIANGGDGAVAAAWFLFNIWITSKALGAADVDAIIKQAQSAGLTVPNEVGPGNWWGGGYTAWCTPLSGSDVIKAASGTIAAGLPYNETINVRGAGPYYGQNTFQNGYAQSLCIWGPLSAYKP